MRMVVEMSSTVEVPSSVHARLRQETAGAHARLEAEVDIFARTSDPSARADLARRFHGFHAGAEAVLEPLLGGIDGLDFAGRRRTPVIEADLRALGHALPDRPEAKGPALADVPEALGLLYVLEGSTLGGRVIRKQLLKAGQDLKGLGFLDPYGEAVAERWRSFLAILDRECPSSAPGRGTAAVRGALGGFAWARSLLPASETV